MMEMLNRRPFYVMILGPLLSLTTSSTAQVSHHWNLTQVQNLETKTSVRERMPRNSGPTIRTVYM